MNQTQAVIWTQQARHDLLGIVQYIKNHNPQNAAAIAEQIKNKTLELNLLPERGRIIPELQTQGIFHYRELIAAPWRILYKHVGNEVFILGVIDLRRNLEDLLLDRLIAHT